MYTENAQFQSMAPERLHSISSQNIHPDRNHRQRIKISKPCLKEKPKKAARKRRHIPHRLRPGHLVAERNARERERMQCIGSAFDRLQNVVTGRCASTNDDKASRERKKMSKAKILQMTISYIKVLQNMLGQPLDMDENERNFAASPETYRMTTESPEVRQVFENSLQPKVDDRYSTSAFNGDPLLYRDDSALAFIRQDNYQDVSSAFSATIGDFMTDNGRVGCDNTPFSEHCDGYFHSAIIQNPAATTAVTERPDASIYYSVQQCNDTNVKVRVDNISTVSINEPQF